MTAAALFLMSQLAATPVAKTQLPMPEWKAGLTWSHERTSDNEVSLVRGDKQSHKLHSRHELIKERLVSKNGNDATADVEISTKTLSTKDLLTGTTEEKTDPASGHTYRVVSLGGKITVTRDGAEVTGDEKRSVVESSLEFGQLTAAAIPPLAPGDSFTLDSASQGQLDRVRDGIAEFTLKSSLTQQGRTLVKTQRARVQVSTGRLLSLEGEGVVTQPGQPDGHLTSKVTYSY